MRQNYRITQQAFGRNQSTVGAGDYIQVIVDIIDTDAHPSTGLVSPHEVTFYSLGGFNYIEFSPAALPFFYVGLVFSITGTSNNNGNFTVVSINPIGINPLYSEVIVTESIVPESVVDPVFTDTTIDPKIIDLIPSGDPVKLSVVDNDEDPMTVIKAQKLELRFNSENRINMNTFASGSDSRWSVHAYIGDDTKTIFKGFLVLDDMSEAFMPEPNIVLLTANDGLGPLKDIPLTDFDGRNPTGYNRIIDYIAWCLSKTGNNLQINCAFNIKNKGLIDDISIPNANDQHFFLVNYLDAKTLEDEIGTCINCYEVLQRILGEEAVIFQRQGMWWIVRIDEIESDTRGLYISTFDFQGTFIANLGEKNFDKEIGKDAPYKILFSKEQTDVVPTRPNKSVELDYPYNLPSEIPDNKEFIRGDVIDESNPLIKTYNLDDWHLFQASVSAVATDSTAFIRRVFNSIGYEQERYVVIDIAGVAVEYYLTSSRIPVQAKDRFDFSVDVKYNDQVDSGAGTITRNVSQIRLYADDGTFWFLHGGSTTDPLPYWIQTNSSFTTNNRYFSFHVDGNYDDTQWSKAEFWAGNTCPDIPVDGYLKIILNHNYKVTQFEINFSNLNFEYIPYINGSYQKYTSQSQTVTQDGKYKAKRKKPVYISDSPKKLFKGALHQILIYNAIFTGGVTFNAPNSFVIIGNLRYLFFNYQRLSITGTMFNNGFFIVKNVVYDSGADNTTIYVYQPIASDSGLTTISEASFKLSDLFYNAAAFPAGYPTEEYLHPYSEIQVFDVWNQFKTDKRIFQAVCQGLDLAEVDVDGRVNGVHLINKYFLRDANENTNNRIFILLTHNQDLRLSEWTGTMREVQNFPIPKEYTGRTFKYLTQ